MVETESRKEEDGKDLFGCDPWFPPPFVRDDPTKPTFIEDTKKKYISRLEEKLARVKGIRGEPTPKDFMKAMEMLHQAHTELLASAQPVYDHHDDDNLSTSSDELSSTTIRKKLFPESVALYMEEKSHLLDHDVVSKHATFPEDKPRPLLMGWIPTDWDEDIDGPTESEDEDPKRPGKYKKGAKKRRRAAKAKAAAEAAAAAAAASPSEPDKSVAKDKPPPSSDSAPRDNGGDEEKPAPETKQLLSEA